MNKTYRLIWSDCRQAWTPAGENAPARGKRSSGARRLVVAAMAALIAWTPAAGYAEPPAPNALPTGGQVAAGAASIAQSGSNMTIQQTSDRAIVNWQSFNIGANASVAFQQPGAGAVALNRVLGSDPSAIYGRLTANGQVFLVNPSGVLFGPGARVDVGGLVASTMSIRDSDFMNGSYRFSRDGATGAVVNQGEIRAQYVALLAPEVRNEGVIAARMGTVAMAAGEAVSLGISGHRLVNVQVDRADIDTLIENRHLVQADGGTVILAAEAARALRGRVVNTGTIEANGIEADGGVIRITASSAIELSGTLSANAGANGRGGTITAIADLANPASLATVSGAISARGGSQSGDGGFIETSASRLKIADSARMDTRAPNGRAGLWLLDPTDFTVAASGGDITGLALAAALGSNDVIIQTGTGTNTATDKFGASGTNGDIFVNDAVSWSTNQKLTLRAHRHIEVNAAITASGSTGSGVALEYGQGALNSGNTAEVFVRAPINLTANSSFSTKLGSDGATDTYTVITAASAANLGDITDMNGKYVLGSDITLTSPQWTPIGDGATTVFNGVFDGLGHTVSGLTHANTNNQRWVGLFGSVGMTGVVQNVGVTGVNVAGNGNVGGLAGENSGTIRNAYSTGTVVGSDAAGVGPMTGTNDDQVEAIGGLVGRNGGNILRSYSEASVTATSGDQTAGGGIGGLAGVHANTNFDPLSVAQIKDSYASGNVSGLNNVGGLVGLANGGSHPAGAAPKTSIVNSYSRGEVNGNGTLNVGGLIGATDAATVAFPNVTGLEFSGNFWDKDTSLQTSSAGEAVGQVTGLSTADMKVAANFTSATAANGNVNPGWDTTRTWKLVNGAYPIFVVGPTGVVTIYIRLDPGGSSIYGNTPVFAWQYFTDPTAGTTVTDANPTGTPIWNNQPTSTQNAGIYSLSYGTGIVLGNAGYSLLAGDAVDWTVNKANLTLGGTRTYNGMTTVAGSVLTATGVLGQTFAVTGAGDASNLASKDVQAGSLLASVTGLALGASGNGGLASNYNVLGTAGSSIDITKANLTLGGARTYDGTTVVDGATLAASGVNGETFALAGAGDASNLASKNVQTGSTLASITGLALGASGNGGLAGNYNAISTAGSSYTINKADLALSGSRTYDGTTAVAGSALTASGINGETFTLTGAGDASNLASKDASATPQALASVTGLALGTSSNGGLAGNYNLATAGSAVTINKANLVLIGSRDYDATTAVAGSVLAATGANGETFAVTGASTVASANANATPQALTGLASLLLGGSSNGGLTGNYNALSATGSQVTITPKPLDITVAKMYDGSDSFTLQSLADSNAIDAQMALKYNNVQLEQRPTRKFTLTGMVSGEPAPTVTGGSATVSSADAATYTAFTANSLTLSDPNYKASGGTVSATIAPRDVEVDVTTVTSAGVFLNVIGSHSGGRPSGAGDVSIFLGTICCLIPGSDARFASATLRDVAPAVSFGVGPIQLVGRLTVGLLPGASVPFDRAALGGLNVNQSMDSYLSQNYRIQGGTISIPTDAASRGGLGIFNGTLYFPDVGQGNATVALSTVGIASVGLRVFDAGQFSLGADLIAGEDSAGDEASASDDSASSSTGSSSSGSSSSGSGSGESSASASGASDEDASAESAESEEMGDEGKKAKGRGKSKGKGKSKAGQT